MEEGFRLVGSEFYLCFCGCCWPHQVMTSTLKWSAEQFKAAEMRISPSLRQEKAGVLILGQGQNVCQGLIPDDLCSCSTSFG